MRIKWVNTHKALRISTGTWYLFNKVTYNYLYYYHHATEWKHFDHFIVCVLLFENSCQQEGTIAWSSFSKNPFQDRRQSFRILTETHPQVYGERSQSPRSCFARALCSFRHASGKSPSCPEVEPPQPSSNSADHSRSHTVKPQLTGLSISDHWRGTASGLSWGAGESQGRLHLSAWKLQAEGPVPGVPVRMCQATHSPTIGLHSLQPPYPQPQEHSQHDHKGHASSFSAT